MTQVRLSDGSRLEYDVQGDGEAVLLIHGHTLTRAMWAPQLEALNGFRVVTPDLRGYGDSDRPTATSNHADDLEQLLNHLGIEQTHVIGLSLGGNVALEFALRHPERTNKLVLVTSSLKGFALEPAYLATLNRIFALASSDGVEAARRAWLEHELFVPARAHPVIGARLEAWVNAYTGWHWLEGFAASAPIRDVSADLERVTAPTLVMIGERDVPEHQRIARTLAERIPNAKLEVIPDAGHMVNLEQAEVFDRIMLEVLREPL
jgi:3-oxoadipate enol-lactonase